LLSSMFYPLHSYVPRSKSAFVVLSFPWQRRTHHCWTYQKIAT
jgi:hypothetical protein